MSSAALALARQFIEICLPVADPGRRLEAVIYQDQPVASAPRPSTASYPYAAIRLSTPEARGSTPALTVSGEAGDPPNDDKVKMARTQLREAVLNVRIYGTGANGLAEELQDARARPDVDVWTRQNGLAVYPVGPVLNDTGLLDTTNEERAQLDLGIRWRDERVDLVSPIDTADATWDVQSSPP